MDQQWPDKQTVFVKRRYKVNNFDIISEFNLNFFKQIQWVVQKCVLPVSFKILYAVFSLGWTSHVNMMYVVSLPFKE